VVTKVSYPLNHVPVWIFQACLTGNSVFFPLCCYSNTEVFCTFRTVFDFHPLAGVPGSTPSSLAVHSRCFRLLCPIPKFQTLQHNWFLQWKGMIYQAETRSIFQPYIPMCDCLPCRNYVTEQSETLNKYRFALQKLLCRGSDLKKHQTS